MYEKRRSKRFLVDLKLDISSLFRQDNIRVDNIHAPIDVIDISRTGIGFTSESVLPLNYYFNAKIQLGDENSCLYTVVKIIRQDKANERTHLYGAEFVGMPAVLMYIFEEFEEQSNKEQS